MKNLLFVTLLFVPLLGHSDMSILFESSYGVTDNDGTSPLLVSGEQPFIQLIYAGADGLVDGAAYTGGALASGDDQILWEGLGPVAVSGDFETEFGTFDAFTVNQSGIPGGSVYGRIFQDSAVSLGSYYWEGPLASMPNVDLTSVPAPTSTLYDVASISDNGVANQQVLAIPEPSSVMLVGIALSAMMLMRRRFRK